MKRDMQTSWTEPRVVIAWFTVALAAGIVAYLLFVPPVIGVADNGDFHRVMGAAGIAYADPQESYASRYFGYAHSFFHYGGFTTGGYVSTHVLLVALAGGIGRLIDLHTFDIRVLGFVYMALMLSAIWLIVRHAPEIRGKRMTAIAGALLSIILIVIFCDVAYTAYYQSFFGEPYALVAIMLAAGAAIAMAARSAGTARPPSAWLLGLFVAAGVALATSKIQNAPLGFLFACLAWRMAGLRADAAWRRRTRIGAGVLALSAVLMMVAAPVELRHINLYQSIFFGVLKDSPDVSRDMRELGIPDKYAGLAGTNYFQKDTIVPQNDPVLKHEVLDRLSHRDIALYYVRHPDRFVSKLKKAAAYGTAIRPYYLGNYAEAEGRKRSALSYAFSTWSEWKHKHMPNTLSWFTVWYLVYYALLGVWWWRSGGRRHRRLLAEMLAVIGLTGIVAVIVSLMGDGEADMAKHLFMFNVSFDMMFAGVLAAASYGLLYAARALTERSGRARRGTIVMHRAELSGYNKEE
ncbi:glycan biosynthesis hexose transferase WsfD [Cohnella sp. 56]|uniref:glycan biosynthesis hexose transferase WsfD n=1 Tax=Cohnella sp. 56 TaxID=3113722 RepID=UPI0030EA31EC